METKTFTGWLKWTDVHLYVKEFDEFVEIETLPKGIILLLGKYDKLPLPKDYVKMSVGNFYSSVFKPGCFKINPNEIFKHFEH